MHKAEYFFILALIVSSVYWIVLYIRLIIYKEPSSYGEKSNNSIILAVKNEASNLQKFLPKLAQQIGLQEMVVVNDFSEDSTEDVLDHLKATIPTLNAIKASKNQPGKKLALSEAILASNHENLLLTDGDCFPTSDEWLLHMLDKLGPKSNVVLGYGPMVKTKGFINLFSRFETVTTAIQYFSFALFKIPYMGVGRNLAFTKSLFQKVNGYKSHEHIPSGDDDLLIQEAKNHTTINVCLHPKSFVYSYSEKKFKRYLSQKKRHMTSASQYSFTHQVLLSIHPFFHLFGFALGLYLIFNGSWSIVLYTYLARWILLMIFGFKAFKKLDGADLILYLPFIDLLLIPYYIYFSFAAFKPQERVSWN